MSLNLFSRRGSAPPAPAPGSDRCRCCGVAVERHHDRHPLSRWETEVYPPTWTTCPACTNQDQGTLLDHALAAVGIEYVGDPVAHAAVSKLAWRADTYEDSRLPSERQVGPHEARRAREQAPGRPSAAPWAHLDPRAVRTAVETAHAAQDAAQQPKQARPCVAGPCGSCGVARSTRWRPTRRFTPAVGSVDAAPRWPLCEDCERVRRVTPNGNVLGENFKQRMTADYLGVTPSMSLPPLKAYAELMAEQGTGPDQAEGHAERFGYITATGRLNVLAHCPMRFHPQDVQDRAARLEAAEARMRRHNRREVFVSEVRS